LRPEVSIASELSAAVVIGSENTSTLSVAAAWRVRSTTSRCWALAGTHSIAILRAPELPGTDEKNIEVKLSNGNLTIKGEKQKEKEEKKKDYYLGIARSRQRLLRLYEFGMLLQIVREPACDCPNQDPYCHNRCDYDGSQDIGPETTSPSIERLVCTHLIPVRLKADI
jgi:hypothetical protein